MIRHIACTALAVGLALAPRLAAAAHHEPVIQVVTVEVAPGKLDAYRAEVKKLAGVLARIDTDAQMRVWETTAGGEDVGRILVGVEYPNDAAWAATTAKTAADPEWQRIVAGLAGMRTLVSTSLWREITPSAAGGAGGAVETSAAPAGGGVLVLTGVAVQPGKLEEYRTLVGEGRAITQRLGLKSRLRLWRAELAGAGTGSVAVGIGYPDLATYVADQGTLGADAEWQKLIARIEAVRTIDGRWLYRDVTP